MPTPKTPALAALRVLMWFLLSFIVLIHSHSVHIVSVMSHESICALPTGTHPWTHCRIYHTHFPSSHDSPMLQKVFVKPVLLNHVVFYVPPQQALLVIVVSTEVTIKSCLWNPDETIQALDKHLHINFFAHSSQKNIRASTELYWQIRVSCWALPP